MDSNKNNKFDDELVKAVAGDDLSNLTLDPSSYIMVAGVGGAGGNAVNHMHKMGITGVNFVVCNTDQQALKNCNVENKIQMGPGLGAGNNPERGRELAIESEEVLRSLLSTSGAKMLFIAAGMGGGTGTGASPVIAKLAHELGILTVAVVTIPLRIEGKTRYEQAARGVAELNQWVDSLLIIDNEKLHQVYGKLPIKEAFSKADDILGMATKGIAELITVEDALVRVDFADVEKVMRGSGRAHMSVVTGSGESRAMQVAETSLASSLLDDDLIKGAKSILLNFSVSNLDTFTAEEMTTVIGYIQKHASYTDEDNVTHMADVIWGASEKPTLADGELELVVVATGFADGNQLKIESTFAEALKGVAKVDDEVDEGNGRRDILIPEPPKRNDKIVAPPQNKVLTITPSQDRYNVIRSQIATPAYKRRNVSFYDSSEAKARTNFNSLMHSVNNEQKPAEDNNSLFTDIQ